MEADPEGDKGDGVMIWRRLSKKGGGRVAVREAKVAGGFSPYGRVTRGNGRLYRQWEGAKMREARAHYVRVPLRAQRRVCRK